MTVNSNKHQTQTSTSVFVYNGLIRMPSGVSRIKDSVGSLPWSSFVAFFAHSSGNSDDENRRLRVGSPRRLLVDRHICSSIEMARGRQSKSAPASMVNHELGPKAWVSGSDL